MDHPTPSAYGRPRPPAPATLPEPPADAPPLAHFRSSLGVYPPALAARWERFATRLPASAVGELHVLLNNTDDLISDHVREEMEDYNAAIVAHLADLPALWDLLATHVRAGCAVPEPEHCPVCQGEGVPS